MLRFKKYNEEKKEEEAWFDSSMIVYTRMVEDPNDNIGELYITYKGGSTYVYHAVRLEDYVLFIAGGTDGSHGKTINKIIKGQYEFEKLEPLDLSILEERLNGMLEEKRKQEEELSHNYNLKWDKLHDSLNNMLSYMDEQKKEHAEITEEMYNELLDLLDMSFGIHEN